MKHNHMLILLTAILFIQCDLLLADDPQIYLEPEDITGVWLRVVEVPSDVPGLYRKETVVYRIGLESLENVYLEDGETLYKPLTFKVIYPHGGTKYGYIHEPKEDYDWVREESCLKYRLEIGLPEVTTRYAVSFTIPKGCPSDTMRVELESEVFGLKKLKGL